MFRQMRSSAFSLAVVVVAWLSTGLASAQQVEEPEEAPTSSAWHLQAYLDAGFAWTGNDPANGTWRSKSTTFVLGEPELFLGMATAARVPDEESRWGFELGAQTGIDSEGLVTAPPPPAYEPFADADTWRHLYRANVSYLVDAGRGVRVTGGLINSYIGYESYLGIDNPNYTRGYLTDTVPYFLLGVEALWDVSDSVNLGFYLSSGYNFLTSPNGGVSPGFQLAWKVSPRTTFTQNLYYGPDQDETAVEFWRFFSDTIVEWDGGPFVLAGAFDFGSEKQARLPGQPRHRWMSGAVWVRWEPAERVSLGFRPELYWDPDGQITQARQLIQAYTGTVKFRLSAKSNRLVGSLEARYDRSTGDDGGFFQGPDDTLVPGQSMLLFGLTWSFER